MPYLENVLAFDRVIDFHVPQQLTDFDLHLKLNNHARLSVISSPKAYFQSIGLLTASAGCIWFWKPEEA
ncbi:hypothetical protein [Microcoleus sp. herbarium12]|uniref:hypothetical protein n=1 Tax=Microcoleus sp. herbarium12 TaxID=3055437 RepID=UPI002FD22D08